MMRHPWAPTLSVVASRRVAVGRCIRCRGRQVLVGLHLSLRTCRHCELHQRHNQLFKLVQSFCNLRKTSNEMLVQNSLWRRHQSVPQGVPHDVLPHGHMDCELSCELRGLRSETLGLAWAQGLERRPFGSRRHPLCVP